MKFIFLLLLSIPCYGQLDFTNLPFVSDLLIEKPWVSLTIIESPKIDHDSLWFPLYDNWVKKKIIIGSLTYNFYSPLCHERKHEPVDVSTKLPSKTVIRDLSNISYKIYYQDMWSMQFTCLRCGSKKEFIFSYKIDTVKIWEKNGNH